MSTSIVSALTALLLLSAQPVWGGREALPPVESWISSEDLTQRLAPQANLAFSGENDARGVVRVDETKVYQTLLGMGSSLEHTTCANLWRLDQATRAEVVERLVSPENGIGMSSMRICIGTPDFTGEPWYSYNDLPPGATDEGLVRFSIDKDRAYVLPILKLALEKNPDLILFASPWSPPGWMKTCGDMIGGHLYPRYYPVYARYFVKFLEAYAAEGIPIRAVTVQNEPGVNKRDDVLSWWYPSCQWSLVEDEDTWWPVSHDTMGQPERDFIRDHLGPAFEANGIKTQIWCYDHNLNNLNYPRTILSDPRAARYVEGVAFHPYAGSPADMGAFHDEFPEKRVFLSEGSMFGVEGAIQIMEFLRNWASAYHAWVTVIDTEGNPNNGPFKTTDTCVTLDPKSLTVSYHFDYYMYGQFMKFIRPGAVRIESTAPEGPLSHVAFRNREGSFVLVVANPEPQATPLAVAWRDRRFSTEIPAKSVATYRWRE